MTIVSIQLRIFVILAFVGMVLGPSSRSIAATEAQPWSGGTWHVRATDQGCLYYYASTSTAEYEAEARRTWYFSINWEGPGCVRGEFINGTGTLVEVQDLAVVAGEPGRSVIRHSGTMVNGLWNGTKTQEEVMNGQRAYSVQADYVLGCSATDRTGQCKPPAARSDGPIVNSRVNSATNSPSVAPATGNGDVFSKCVRLTQYPKNGSYQTLWALNNLCDKSIIVSYCFKANVEAAGDENLCSRREKRTHEIPSGGNIDFAFTPVEQGSAMSDGTYAGPNSLSVVGFACSGGNFPQVYFDQGSFKSRGC